MEELKEAFLSACTLLERARKVIIISHRGPDGDTVGANLALRLGLKYQRSMEVVSACIDPPPTDSDFLPEVNAYVRDFDPLWADVIIAVDAGAHYMLKFHETKPDLFSGTPPLINIDHHASNDLYGKVNMVAPNAAATTEIIYHFLKFCGFKIDRKIATCLLHGLYFDTGSFMHSNTSAAVLEIASDLVWKGADFKTIAKKQFHTMSVPQLKLYGKILERAQVNSKGFTISAVGLKDMDEAGVGQDGTMGAIDYLNWINEGSVSCLIHEDRKGGIKGSFRSRVDDVDLSKLAGLFGGGGHKKASGFSFPGRLLEVNPKIRIGE